MKLAIEWQKPLHEPEDDDKDWSLVLPFCQTLKNAFDSMCDVQTIGLRQGKEGRCYTFLKDAKSNDQTLPKIRTWIQLIGSYVAIRDCLPLSFALDYDREHGNPEMGQTVIGALRTRAKPYKSEPTSDTYSAADQLVEACACFIERVYCYQVADSVVAMPRSNPEKEFDLPSYLANGLAKRSPMNDLSHAVRTVRGRPPIKNLSLDKKLEVLEGTIQVDQDVFSGRIVLLLDDLYQSGVSMNYTAMMLLEAGAEKILGLACEKTCRNDDNLSWRQT